MFTSCLSLQVPSSSCPKPALASMVRKSLLATLVWLQVHILTTATLEQVCDGDCVQLSQEAEVATMLQTGKQKHSGYGPINFLKSTVADTCEDPQFSGQFQNGEDSSCGNNSPASTCTLTQLAEEMLGCWALPVNCAAGGDGGNNEYYTHKYEGGHVGSTLVVDPIEYVCITATCVCSGGGLSEEEEEEVEKDFLLTQTQGTELVKNRFVCECIFCSVLCFSSLVQASLYSESREGRRLFPSCFPLLFHGE